MADIQNLLQQLLTAIYGKDVRQAIVDCIKQCYNDASTGLVPVVKTKRVNTGIEITITVGVKTESFVIEDAYNPVRGTDYWTDEDIAIINAEVHTMVLEETAKRGQLKPEFAQTVEDCTDTTKVYVLPDGFIYAYMYSEIATGGCTNHANTLSADWWSDSRLDSSGNQSTGATGRNVTNPVRFTEGDVIRLKDLTLYTSDRFAVYDANLSMMYLGSGSSLSEYMMTETDGTIVFNTSRLPDINEAIAGCSFIRLPVQITGDTPIITVNEEIITGSITRDYAWTNTGHAFVPADYEAEIASLIKATNKNAVDIEELKEDATRFEERLRNFENKENVTDDELPSYWQEYLGQKIVRIKELQDAGGKDCFSYIVITDIHYESNLGKLSVLLAKKIAEECGIKYIIVLGDTQTRHGANHKYEYIENEWVEIENMLSPIRDQLLITLGNHDGSYGIIDENNDGVADDINSDGVIDSYDKNVYNYPPQKLHERAFRKVKCIDNVHFSTDGNGYYVDDTGSKVRYIILNSHVNKYELNADGSMKYNNMYNFRFGQSQYDMVIEALKSIPSDEWSVIVGSHVPLDRTAEYEAWGGTVDSNGAQIGNPADCVVMQRMLNAYHNKTSYSGSFTGTQDGFDTVSVNVDFSDAKGQIIAYHGGHAHIDNALPPSYSWNGAEHSDFYTVLTRCDGACENSTTLLAERVAGTITEQSFDVFTNNKAERKLYATKIGAGEDRVISY